MRYVLTLLAHYGVAKMKAHEMGEAYSINWKDKKI
jgi:hypothetical protein